MLTSTVTFENLYYSGNIVDCGGNDVITTPICDNIKIYVNIFCALNKGIVYSTHHDRL